MRGIMVDKKAVDNRFPVAVGKHCRAEYPRGLEGRSCGQSNLNRIKILNDHAVFANIISLVTIEHLSFG